MSVGPVQRVKEGPFFADVGHSDYMHHLPIKGSPSRVLDRLKDLLLYPKFLARGFSVKFPGDLDPKLRVGGFFRGQAHPPTGASFAGDGYKPL